MAAHLAGVLAAHTILPVIGIPCKSSNLEGMDALLSTVQMPKGIPVATVAINGAYNAGILALQILGISDEKISGKLIKMKSDMVDEVVEKDKKLQTEILG
jgi:5-(carboxyamino)imidazole ribonucleotide mutase